MPFIIPVFINHAGCPQQCAFCDQRRINRQAEFSLAAVKRQIDKYLSFSLTASEEKELAFYGGSFTGLPGEQQEELLTVADELRQTGKIARLRLSARPDHTDETALARLLRYRVDMVELGVQSLDDKVLLLAKRGHDAESVYKAAALLRAAGIAFGVQLMLGLPGQDWQSLTDTVEQVIKLRPAVVRIYPLLIFAGTEFAGMWQAGELTVPELHDAVEQAAYMAEQFAAHGIKVIRIGLQDDEGLREAGQLLAGPYHPAFGELTASRRYREKIENLLATRPHSGQSLLTIPKGALSKAIGHKKSNLYYFKRRYPDLEITFKEADCPDINIL